jgi:hypothetical protein
VGLGGSGVGLGDSGAELGVSSWLAGGDASMLGAGDGWSPEGDAEASARTGSGDGLGAGVAVAAATAPVGVEVTTNADKPSVTAVSRATTRTASREVDRSEGCIVSP